MCGAPVRAIAASGFLFYLDKTGIFGRLKQANRMMDVNELSMDVNGRADGRSMALFFHQIADQFVEFRIFFIDPDELAVCAQEAVL